MYKVLLVEDEEMIRKGLSFSFDWVKADCIVIAEAANGVEGVAKIKEYQPDIVVTDVGMPLKNGIEMLQETMAEYQYAAIIISVYDEFHYAKAAMHMGVSEYLLKPLVHTQLEHALRKAQKECEIKTYYQNSVTHTEKVMNQTMFEKQVIIPQTTKSRRVKRMIAYIEDTYKKKASLEQIAEELMTSSTYLSQKFKEETGYTFKDFLIRYRIQKAIELLKEGNHKIYNIATETGFSEYKYFIHVFRKYTGVSPGKFSEYFGDE
ncbi:MAG: response regulator transcription factor [Lachnospiraceae bacterium]